MQTAPKKVINAWAMYDWANSAYNLVITSTIFPAYYVGITAAANAGEKSYVSFFGRRFIGMTGTGRWRPGPGPDSISARMAVMAWAMTISATTQAPMVASPTCRSAA